MQALELDSRNVKALYRRAQAYINLADLDLAEFDIKKALEIEPDNRYVLGYDICLTLECDVLGRGGNTNPNPSNCPNLPSFSRVGFSYYFIRVTIGRLLSTRNFLRVQYGSSY